MIKILFVCHGNICRSPMAEFIFKDMVKRAGKEENYQIASAATSREELGNPVYPPARRKLNEHGIDCSGKFARQMTVRDYDIYDLLIGMDRANIRNMLRICGGDPLGKIHMLMEYADKKDGGSRTRRWEVDGSAYSREVDDPWYSGDFDAAWRDIYAGCEGLLEKLLSAGEI